MRLSAGVVTVMGIVAVSFVAADSKELMSAQQDQMIWKAFELSDLEAERRESGRPWLEFLRVESMFAGVYVLEAGAEDRQQPHDEDELYYVVRGRGVIRVEGGDTSVGPGSLVYVKAGAEHRFHSIEEDLVVVVFFARQTKADEGG
ncbi:MAG: cupin domain-containing protein [Gemmatimonadales bacterium]